MTIISKRESPAGKNFLMTTFRRALPSSSFSSGVSLTSSFSSIPKMLSFLKFMMASNILKMGSKTKELKARSRDFPPSRVPFVVHFFVAGLK